ncbi:unnamed protein product [Cunninghamella blakesleeana]
MSLLVYYDFVLYNDSYESNYNYEGTFFPPIITDDQLKKRKRKNEDEGKEKERFIKYHRSRVLSLPTYECKDEPILKNEIKLETFNYFDSTLTPSLPVNANLEMIEPNDSSLSFVDIKLKTTDDDNDNESEPDDDSYDDVFYNHLSSCVDIKLGTIDSYDDRPNYNDDHST